MRNRNIRASWLSLTAAGICALWLLLPARPAEAQGTRTLFFRGGISSYVYNGGTADYLGTGGIAVLGMAYPQVYHFGQFAYGDIRVSRFSWNFRAVQQTQRKGAGYWYFTDDRQINRTGYITLDSGVRYTKQYDMTRAPELAQLGYDDYPWRRTTLKMGYGAGVADASGFTQTQPYWWHPASNMAQTYAGQAGPAVVINNFRFQQYQESDEWPEQILITTWSTDQGLTTVRRTICNSHPDFDDFYIDELVVTNDGDVNADGVPDSTVVPREVFIATSQRIAPSTAGVNFMRYLWDYDRDWNMDDWYEWDATNKVLQVWDGDHPLYNNWDDTGDPFYDSFAAGQPGGDGGRLLQAEEQIMSYATVGGGPVATGGTDFPFNLRDQGKGYVVPDGPQPYAVRFYERFDANRGNDPGRDGETTTDPAMYDKVLGPGRSIDPNPNHPSGQVTMEVYGPYNLAPGDSLKLVVAYAAGHPGNVLGAPGQAASLYNNQYVWARDRNRSVAQKQSELTLGKQALVMNMNAARFYYQSAYDIPDNPPDVNFKTGSSSRASMTVDWPDDMDTAQHPDYAGAAGQDIAGYRVYKSDEWFGWGPWKLVADIPVGVTSYENALVKVTYPYSDPTTGESNLYLVEDKQSAAGFFYHYSVRGYQKPHLDWNPNNAMSGKTYADLPQNVKQHLTRGIEGNWVAPTQRIHADESPFAPSSPAADAMSEDIRVVPNPYYPDNVHEYPASTKLRFVGIPSKCTIRIFTISGDLVSELIHDDATKGERDYDQITWNNSGELASGVYFYVVENQLPGYLGKLKRGAFMVIR